jgi:hypothetical protein
VPFCDGCLVPAGAPAPATESPPGYPPIDYLLNYWSPSAMAPLLALLALLDVAQSQMTAQRTRSVPGVHWECLPE